MKNVKLLSLLIGIMIFSIDAFSHGKTENKNRCSWGWKHKAIAQVNNGPGIRRQSQRGCSGSYGYTAEASYDCVWQWTRNTGGYGQYQGAVTATSWLCGRGFSNSELFYDLYTNSEESYKKVYEESSIKHNPVKFSKNNVVIPNLNGEILVNNDNVFSSLEIIVWKPNHDFINNVEDTIADKSDYLWQGKIELLNGKAILTGDFPEDSYQLIKLKDGYKIHFDNETISAKLPESINGEEDEIIVSIITDGGLKEKSYISNIVKATDENSDITLNLYPNPTVNIVNINFIAPTNDYGTVKIYSSSGQFISTIYEGEFETELKLAYNFSEKDLRTGIYYILVKSKKEQYIKKISYIDF